MFHQKTTVAVLRGGPSREYNISLKSGAAVLEALDRERYEPRDVFIDRAGVWHVHGAPLSPDKALRNVDVAFNALHGEYGEDGRIQRELDLLGTPYTGAGSIASALSFNKQRTKDMVAALGIKVPHGAVLSRPADVSPDILEREALTLFRSFPMPAMVKPIVGGSSIGMTFANDFSSLFAGLENAFEMSPRALVEEFIRGREATVGVIDDFRGESLYALLPAEIVPHQSHSFFDYEAKYDGSTLELCPGRFTESEKQELMDAARRAHQALELSHYSRSDFIVSRRGIYFLEANSAAGVGLSKESILPKALQAVGTKLSDFLSHIIELARGLKRN